MTAGPTGAVAAGHPVTARVGAETLARGGTAVDACVAAAMASWVAEPGLTGPGGGGFMLVHDPRSRRTVALDCFVAVPGIGRRGGPPPDMDEIDVVFPSNTQRFRVGPASWAVPGVPAGLAEAHRRFGRLPWASLVEPAIRLAREGAEVTEAHAVVLGLLDAILRREEAALPVFGPDGRLLAEGDLVRNEALADTLERVAEHGASELYTGETGRRIVEAVQARDGLLTGEDMAAYRVVARRPLRVPFAGATAVLNPPPSSGGVLIGRSLAVLDLLGVDPDPFDVRSLRHLAGALRAAQAARTPAFERSLWRGGAARAVLDPAAVGADAERIAEIAGGEPAAARGTTHISVVTAGGSAAALTCSTGCGSGAFAGDTGVHLNNMLGEDDLTGGALRLQPGQRMTSMMSPTLVLAGHGVALAAGSSGSERIRSAVVQVLVQAIARSVPVQEAIELPRIHPHRDSLDCEGGFPDEVLDELEAGGLTLIRWSERSLYFGGAQAVARHADGRVEAAGDPRRGGAAALA